MSGRGDAALEALERRIGHGFSDRTLLKLALTHSSAAVRQQANTNNERLEFLGDRVLGLVVAEMVMARFPEAHEGELSRWLATLVRKEACAEIATEIELGSALKLGIGRARHADAVTASMLSDACEALIAALYLDGGMDVARSFIKRHWGSRIREGAVSQRDAKTTLQEWAQARRLKEPTYTIVEKSGPQHDLRFLIEVKVDGFDTAQGTGKTRREAEQNAAASMLHREGVWKAAAGGH
jgi:ribonuclease-3